MQEILVVSATSFDSGIFILPFKGEISYFGSTVEVWLALLRGELCSGKVKSCIIVLLQLLKVAQRVLTFLFNRAVIGTILLAYGKFINRLLSFTL